MTGNLLVYIAIFCAGLFVGSNLGVLLMCVLHASAGSSQDFETPVTNVEDPRWN